MNEKAPRSIGLCADCVHAKIISSDKGQRYIMCLYSKIDAEFPKYPKLPILQCKAYNQISSSQHEHRQS